MKSEVGVQAWQSLNVVLLKQEIASGRPTRTGRYTVDPGRSVQVMSGERPAGLDAMLAKPGRSVQVVTCKRPAGAGCYAVEFFANFFCETVVTLL